MSVKMHLAVRHRKTGFSSEDMYVSVIKRLLVGGPGQLWCLSTVLMSLSTPISPSLSSAVFCTLVLGFSPHDYKMAAIAQTSHPFPHIPNKKEGGK